LFKFGGEIAGAGTSVSSLLKVIKGYSRLLKPKNKKKLFSEPATGDARALSTFNTPSFRTPAEGYGNL